MTKLLIRLFVRNWENTDSPAVRESYGKLAGITGVVTNLLLALLKLLSGWFFNSIAIMADAVNNLSDSASSIVTLVDSSFRASLPTPSTRMAMPGLNISPV